MAIQFLAGIAKAAEAAAVAESSKAALAEGTKVAAEGIAKDVAKIPSELNGLMQMRPELQNALLEKLNPSLSEIDPLKNADVSHQLEQKLSGNGIEQLNTINKEYEGLRHPDTDVPYERSTIQFPDGRLAEGVFPKFDSVYDANLPSDMRQASRSAHNVEANSQLNNAIKEDPDLGAKFDDVQREQIMDGQTPDGYTWHHHEESGRMQLVDTQTHELTRHTGGYSIWGTIQS